MPCKFATNTFSALDECYCIYEFTMASKLITAILFLGKDIWIRHIPRISILLAAELQHLFHMLLYLVHWLTSNRTGFCRVYYSAVRVLINMFLHLEFKTLLSIKKYKLTAFFLPRNLALCSSVHCHSLCIAVVTDSRRQFGLQWS